MTDQQPWPVDDGSLALVLVGRLLKAMHDSGAISPPALSQLLRETVNGAGSEVAQKGTEHRLRQLFPGLSF